ncbi:hypothetical protein L210DRAFT_870745, partial [Boletus edulis BED1]
LQRAWIAIRWYYKKCDISNNIKLYVGKMELVISDHIDIIAPEQIMSPADIMDFTEGDVSGPFIGRQDLYTRWSMKVTTGRPMLEENASIPCQVCDKAYNPDKDEQRHCHGCNSWLHSRCLESLPKGSTRMKEVIVEMGKETKLSLDTDFIKLLCIPTLRGKSHGVVGNGLQTSWIWEELHQAQKARKEDIGIAWKTQVGPDTMNQANKSHVYCRCSMCERQGREWYL